MIPEVCFILTKLLEQSSLVKNSAFINNPSSHGSEIGVAGLNAIIVELNHYVDNNINY